MKQPRVVLALACLGLSVTVMALRADDGDKDRALRAKLVGTWRPAKMLINGEQANLPETAVTYKHITPEGFTWLSYEKDTGKIFRAAGGTYALHGNTYTEKIEYGMGDDFEVVKNTEPSFTCKIEGDKWHHNGKLVNGTTIEEVWERVKPQTGSPKK